MLAEVGLALYLACTPMPTCGISPCASPTPTLGWDADTTTATVAYNLYIGAGDTGPWLLLDQILCEYGDPDETITCSVQHWDDPRCLRRCRGAGGRDLPVQRYGELIEFRSYWFVAKAVNYIGLESLDYSTPPVEVCIPHIWDGMEPYN